MLYKPDFNKAYIAASIILIKTKCAKTFPIPIKTLINNETDIKLCPYSYAKSLNFDTRLFQSTSAQLVELQGRYIIFYNDEKPSTHIKFSIAHEMAHYILGHLSTVKNSENDSDLYKTQEIEANYFAAQILMPAQIIDKLKRRGVQVDKDAIKNIFGVSNSAAHARSENLSKTLYFRQLPRAKALEHIFLATYQSYIKSLCQRKLL